MSSILIIANGAPYGNETLFNSLRLAITLKEQHPQTELNAIIIFRQQWRRLRNK